ncbi:hypothetical protein AB0N89_25340 [Amycolatopsis sp. NPDC089917]|uniref:ABC transporter substrate-binding protein n=1 Tax=Amycolatopsis sp. NPDC089917 TaxID=3155187 RepID=UPI0034329D13
MTDPTHTRGTGDADFVPPITGGWRKRRLRRRIALAVVAVVVAAGLSWGAVTVAGVCGSPGSGVSEVDDECVGITDGSYVFQADLEDVQKKIEEENARVRETPGYVTVALLDPLVAGTDSALPAAQVRNRLEGAYTALRRVNTTPVAGDSSPQIQLVLANGGKPGDQWQRVKDQLAELSQEEANPLVAVIGLGVSTKQTREQAEDLASRNIPMVGAYLTADRLDYKNIPGFVKTSPSNRHYVEALHRYLDSDTGIKSAIMVRDSNSDAGKDLYTQTLENEFERQMTPLMQFPTQQFTGTSIPGAGAPDLFANVRANICASAASGLQAVLYAGREIDLSGFLESLEHRTCNRTPLTILTAGLDLGEILAGKEQQLQDANLSLIAASTVDAEGWRRNETAEGTPEHFRQFRPEFEKDFPSAHLDDAGAIMMHDALLTAAQAIRLASPNGAASNPDAGDVRAQLLNINTLQTVQGASGTLSFSMHPTAAGNPFGKPVPVLRYPKEANAPSRQVGPLYRVTN